jgi:hypothetical protein
VVSYREYGRIDYFNILVFIDLSLCRAIIVIFVLTVIIIIIVHVLL